MAMIRDMRCGFLFSSLHVCKKCGLVVEVLYFHSKDIKITPWLCQCVVSLCKTLSVFVGFETDVYHKPIHTANENHLKYKTTFY